MKRAIVIILDSVGIGHAPDAAAFGDEGSNTLCHTVEGSGVSLPNLADLGIGNINQVDCIESTDEPMASFGRMIELSKGKDTTIGHWEIGGLKIDRPFPVYPEGFPAEVMDAFHKAIGKQSLVNKPYSGTVLLEDWGEEHMKTGLPLVYTSSDSVFQIAAHEDIIPLEELYDMSEKARQILTGDHAVARVISRPFVGEPGNFTRTSNRRDFSLNPFEPTILDHLNEHGYDVIGVGKIGDIYNDQGISQSIHTDSNLDGIQKIIQEMKKPFRGLLFANLVDFDAKFGHRRNVQGYADALKEFDDHLPEILSLMQPDDLLIITADHGNDPSYKGTDHTRETVPLLIYQPAGEAKDLGDVQGFFHVAATLADYFELAAMPRGKSLL